MSVVDSEFRDNAARLAGGGVELLAGSLALRNTLFDNNEAGATDSGFTGLGGAVHAGASGVTSVTATDGTLAQDNVAASGGAFWNGPNGTLRVADSVLFDNFANGRGEGHGGGGIFNGGGDVSLVNSLIPGGGANGISGSGGGILSTGGSLLVRSSRLNDAFPAFAGGSVAVTGGTATLDAVTVFNFVGEGSSPQAQYGGALYVGGQGTAVEVIDSLISDAQASAQGGGMWIGSGSTLSLVRTALRGNSAPTGGGIFNDGGAVSLNDSHVSNNAADLTGGGIFTAAGGTTTLIGSVVADNVPDDLAGPGTVN